MHRILMSAFLALAASASAADKPESTDGKLKRLIKQLADGDWKVRAGAADVLAKLGPDAGPAVPALIEAARDKHKSVRVCAIVALARIGPQAETAVPVLIDVLADPVEEVRATTGLVLAEFGPQAKAAVPALLGALKDKSEHVRRYAALALGQIGSGEATVIAALSKVLTGDEDDSVQGVAADALGRLGPQAKAAVPALLQTLQGSKPLRLRTAAIDALGDIGTDAEAVITSLTEAQKDKDGFVRERAAEALKKIRTAKAVALKGGAADAPKAERPPETKVLQRFVGSWDEEIVQNAAEWTPKAAKAAGFSTRKLVLAEKVMQCRYVSSMGDFEQLQMMMFDPATGTYRTWTFGSAGTGTESEGTWHEDSRTLAFKGSANGIPLLTQYRFADADSFDWSMKAEDGGAVYLDMRGTAKRRKNAFEAKPVRTGTMPPPELKVLDGLVGQWDSEYVIKPSVSANKELRGTAVEVNEWVLDGRFVQGDGRNAAGREIITVFGYDTKDGEYRLWHFTEAYASRFSGQWNEASKTFSWRGEHGDGTTTTATSHFTGKDSREFHAVTKDDSGKVYSDIEGKLKRRK